MAGEKRWTYEKLVETMKMGAEFARRRGVDETAMPAWLSAQNTRQWATRLMVARIQQGERARVAMAVRAMRGHRDWVLVASLLEHATPAQIIDAVLEGVAQALETNEGAEVEHV